MIALLLVLLAPTGEEAIRTLFDRLMAADNRGDVDAVLACYAEDAVLLPPGEPPVEGRSNVRPRYESLFQASRLQVRMEVESIEVDEGLAFSRGLTRGQVIPRDGSPAREILDRYLMVRRRGADGEWRIAVLMWSPSAKP